MQLSWLDDAKDVKKGAEAPCTLEDLAQAGVYYRYLSTDPAAFEPALAALCTENSYVARDEVGLSPETPNLPVLLDKFKDEHLHTEDEVRFVLAGEGVFDIRSIDDRWMRVQVSPGDLIVVPRDRYHRFTLTDACRIRCVRLFQDKAGWTPVYRSSPPAASV